MTTPTHECFMSHTWMVAKIDTVESCHIFMSQVTYIHVHIRMSHVIYTGMLAKSDTAESCHIGCTMPNPASNDPLSEAAKTPPAVTLSGTDFPHSSSSASGQESGARRSAAPAWQSLSSGSGDGHVTLIVVGPDGSKTPLTIRLTDDVATLRALVTQM